MSWKIDTKCIQGGYNPKNGDPRVTPIYQSTTYAFDSSEHVANLFDLSAAGHFYTRLSNPTVEVVENKISELEGGVGALCTSSGQSATMNAVLNICSAGDHFISSSTIYGGTFNLFGVTLKKMGIEVTFVDSEAKLEDLQKEIKENTKLIFGETLANPNLNILDIEKFAELAHKNDIPLIIDNTLATPILCRPIEYGADIVVHSTSKYMDGHATSIGGVIVDSGRFNWNNGKFPELVQPDPSYHGLSYTETFGNMAYIVKARVQYMRDIGNCMSPMNAFLTNIGLETLHLRMERHSENALEVAKFLELNENFENVRYPGLKSNNCEERVKKYLPKGSSGVISFNVKGGKEEAIKFLDSLKLARIVVHVSDCRTSVLHPASSTHRQLTKEQLKNSGIDENMIRMSVGIENAEDIIADIKNAID